MCDDLLNERQHFIKAPSLEEANALVDDYNKLLAYFLDDTDGFTDDGPFPSPSKIKPPLRMVNKVSELLDTSIDNANASGIEFNDFDKLDVIASMNSRQTASLLIYFAYLICDEDENKTLILLNDYIEADNQLDETTKDSLTTYIEEQNSTSPTL